MAEFSSPGDAPPPCARCGEQHTRELEWHEFARPMLDADGVTYWTWWALCTNTGEPVVRAGVSNDAAERMMNLLRSQDSVALREGFKRWGLASGMTAEECNDGWADSSAETLTRYALEVPV